MSRPSHPPDVSAARLQRSINLPDRALSLFGNVFGFVAPVVVLAIIANLASVVIADAEGSAFLSTSWNPARGHFGVLPFLMGTVVTATVAMAIALPIGVLAAVYLAEVAAPKVARVGAVLLELVAATPAVVVGLWGRSVLVPELNDLSRLVGSAPEGHGFGIVAASLVLATMTIPTIATVSRAILRALPNELREGPMALGATQWETIRSVLLPSARRGLLAAAALGFGRALGETIAVSMVIGGRPSLLPSWGAPSATVSSVLVDEVLDATHPNHIAALAALALVLLVFGALTSAGARVLSRGDAVRA